MKLIEKTISAHQVWGFQKDIAVIFSYRSPSGMLKRYRDFCDRNKSFFEPHKPYLDFEDSSYIYDIYCFAYYFENRGLLESGTRSLRFKDDLKRLKEVYVT